MKRNNPVAPSKAAYSQALSTYRKMFKRLEGDIERNLAKLERMCKFSLSGKRLDDYTKVATKVATGMQLYFEAVSEFMNDISDVRKRIRHERFSQFFNSFSWYIYGESLSELRNTRYTAITAFCVDRGWEKPETMLAHDYDRTAEENDWFERRIMYTLDMYFPGWVYLKAVYQNVLAYLTFQPCKPLRNTSLTNIQKVKVLFRFLGFSDNKTLKKRISTQPEQEWKQQQQRIHYRRYRRLETYKREAAEYAVQQNFRIKYLQTIKDYPFVDWSKYKRRLVRCFMMKRKKDTEGIYRRPAMSELMEAGIPARQLVGPYTYEKPADYIRSRARSSKLQQLVGFVSSPTVSELIKEINKRQQSNLDPYDEELARQIHALVTTHGNRTPSVRLVFNINKALERERMEASRSESFEIMQQWLKKTKKTRQSLAYILERLPDGFIAFDSNPATMEELFYRAQRWGMCIFDQMSYWIDEDEDEMEIIVLVMATDRKRGTVCGLNSDMICPSSHWCTGVNNRIDSDAYDLFSDKQWWWEK